MTKAEIIKKFEKAIKSDLKESTPSNLPKNDTFDIKAFEVAAERAARVLGREEDYADTKNRTVRSAH